MQVSEFLAMQRQELGLGCFCVSENILGTFSGFHKILLQIGKRIEWTSRWKVWTLASTVRKEIVRRLTNRFSELSIICNNASYTCILKTSLGDFHPSFGGQFLNFVDFQFLSVLADWRTSRLRPVDSNTTKHNTLKNFPNSQPVKCSRRKLIFYV